MGYQEEELKLLHIHLYDILARTIKVCERLDIQYFIIGGSAIGALFDGAILPWDDDIDIGMERADYDRFLAEGAAVMPKGYTIQSPLNEGNTPYYFSKVRKDHTRFEGEDEAGLDMHHGVYIDIFPMDRVPDCKPLERAQRAISRHLINAFVASTIELREGGAFQKWVVNSFAKVCGKRLIYKMLTAVQTMWNSRETEYINIIYMPRDHIRRSTLHPPATVDFGPLKVKAPQDMERYLNNHYPNLHRPPKEEQINHAPQRLNLYGDE